MDIIINCTGTEKLKLDDMTLFQGALKTRTDADYEHIKKSILDYGFCAPFFIWKYDGLNSVLDGTGRYETLQRMKADGYGIPLLPVVYIDCKDEATAKKVLLQINSHNGTMTVDSVRDFLGDVEFNFGDITLPDSGALDFSDDENDSNDTDGDNDIPDVQVGEAISKKGEIYILGNSRLMCGDSTDIGDVDKLFSGEKANLLFTSPPYSDERTYNGGKDLSIDNLVQFIGVWSKYALYEAINLGLQYKNHEINQYWDNYISTAKKCGLKLISWNVWNKTMAGSIGNQKHTFPVYHEWIFVFGSEEMKCNPIVEKSENTKITKTKSRRQADGSMKISSTGDMSNNKTQVGSVIDLLPEMGSIRSEHPATFPVELPQTYIEAMTNENDIIAEPFTGSGTTIIAAEKVNRRCFGMELDPHYCDVIRRRWTKWARANGKEAGTGALD